jgi:hypothetical protein
MPGTTRGHQIIRAGVQAGPRGVEVEHCACPDQEVIIHPCAQRADQGDRARGGQGQLHRPETGFHQAIYGCFRAGAGCQAEHRNHPQCKELFSQGFHGTARPAEALQAGKFIRFLERARKRRTVAPSRTDPRSAGIEHNSKSM